MEESSPLFKVISRCNTCHGAGVLPGQCHDNELLPCPTCKGKGVIERKKSKTHSEERQCDNPNCKDGMVKQPTVLEGRKVSTEKICPVCQGEGQVQKKVVTTTIELEKCPSCGGNAVLTAGEMRRRKIEGFCPDCHGIGYKVERKAKERAVRFSITAFLYPAITTVGSAFFLMLKGVKAAIVTKTQKNK
jgi:DnaJ-class molecular chaperone